MAESNGGEISKGDCGVNGTFIRAEKSKFLKDVAKVLIEDGVEVGTDINSKIVEFVHPEELKKRLDLSIPELGASDEVLLQLCRDTIRYSVKTGHQRFFNQLFSGLTQYGLAGAWLTETMNTSQYTYEVAPVFTLMEKEIIEHMAKFIGYREWDGTFCPGGSVSNMFGLNIGRYHKFPIVKEEGMQALPRVCLFTSEQSHYSLKKGAAFLGIGLKSIITVPCDEHGKMKPDQLELLINKAKEEGYTPFFVHATGGTTVAGAYDPIEAIADVCTRHGLWLHLDACWGGGVLLSRKHKHLLDGIDRCDSVAWNAHKMMGAPLQCCAFITKHNDLLKRCHSANATYLFQQDKFYDVSYDTGDKSVLCGRKIDAFKIWLLWKAKGDQGFEDHIDTIFENDKYLTQRIIQTEGFRIVFAKPECTNVCFWYVPPCLRGQKESTAWWERLAKVAPMIKERMVMTGTLLIGYQPLGSKVNFFRMVICNPETTLEDMDFVVDEIDRLGKDLEI